MNWRNPFLNAYLAVTVIGAALLGYLVYSSYSHYAEVSETYDTKVAQLQKLQNRKPYPSDENNRAFTALTTQYRAEYDKLIAQVSKMQKPLEPITPQAFQDRLRANVSEVVAAAREAGVKVADGFYLGFDQYRDSPPSNEAAGALARELDAIRLIVDRLLSFKVREILGVKRDPLPEERGSTAAPAPTPPPTRPVAGRPRPTDTRPSPKILHANAFDVAFVADQSRARQTLNAIATANQFFIIRNLNIVNSRTEGPKRNEDPAAAATPPPANPDEALGALTGEPPAVPAAPTMRLLTGRETLTIALRIEMITFTPSVRKELAPLPFPDPMDWLKQHYDRVILAVLGLLGLAFAGIIIIQALSFNEIFDSRNSAKKPDNSVPSPGIDLIKERSALIEKPDEWGAHKGSLFVSEPWLMKDDGQPVPVFQTSAQALHPPIPNDWLIKFNLDYADPNLPNADPDGDKFSNLEEFNGKTDPTAASSKPGYITKLRLLEFVQVPFRLKFSGTPDEGQTFSINTLDLRQPTAFLPLGAMIPKTPYKIFKYDQKFVDKQGMKEDVSELIVENQDTGQKIALVYDKPVNDPTVYAKFKYLWDGSEFRVKKNESFSVKPDDAVKYKLIDISDTEAVIESPQGDKIHVPKGNS